MNGVLRIKFVIGLQNTEISVINEVTCYLVDISKIESVGSYK